MELRRSRSAAVSRARRRSGGWRGVPLLTLTLPLLVAAGPAPAPVLGTWRVRAAVRLDGVPLVRTMELRGDVRLVPGAAPGAVVARLAARGHACELAGRLEPSGEVTLAAGQRCTVTLEEPEVHGRVDAEVHGGRARVGDDGALALGLEAGLAGAVRIATGGLPGLPAETALPVNGSASVRADGWRDNSRAADTP
jgi:hypothetical protein